MGSISQHDLAMMQQRLARGRATTGAPMSAMDGVGDGEEIEKLHNPTKEWLTKRGIAFSYNRPDKASTTTPGTPDFIIAVGDGVFVEYKTRTGKLNPDQVIWHHLAARHGVTVRILRSMTEFHALMAENGVA